MQELAVVEALIGVFLLMHTIVPYIKAFRQARGFVFFPPLALFCCAAMIPAYGFRPECIPLFFVTLLYNFFNFPYLASVLSRLKTYDTHTNSILVSFFSAFCLAFSLTAAFSFLPLDETNEKQMSDKNEFLYDEERDAKIFLSYYNSIKYTEQNNLIILAPPVIFSLPVVEEMCFALRNNGYNVIAFSRANFDSVDVSVLRKLKLFQFVTSGIKDIKLFQEQRKLVKERAFDMKFILANKSFEDYDNIYLTGYGAGGAAALELIGDKALLENFPKIKAACAIESLLLCDFAKRETESKTNNVILNKITEIWQKPVLKFENVVHPELPFLFIAGDGAQAKTTKRRYISAVQTMFEAQPPFLIASINGANEIDFSTIARQYPVLRFFLKSRIEARKIYWPRDDIIKRTAEYIALFFNCSDIDSTVNIIKQKMEMPDVVFLETSR